ncbi:unnamed protein product [Anisakis simplex]|uniref:Utp12 domain-containing protein n=1 Tax=Anisakis simplex TaxID=6269 RepID=A0A0M3KCB4_ANISI|nr:unnamed protein product [Anisakis simplex]
MRSRTSQRTRTSISNDISNGPVCDHGLSNGNGDEPMDAVKMEHKSEIKVNGTPRSLKQQKKDMMDMILKDRLKALNDSIDKSDSISNDAESTTQLIENASTSKDGTVQQNASEAGDHSARRGESLAVLLSQGLTSGDAEKIDSVLSRSDPQTISATLNELPVTQILPLLKQIEFRFRNRKTLDVRCWARWMQCTISMHAPYLSTIGSLESELGTLYNWMRNRSANISSLYNLHGKFTLLLEQIERRANPKFFIFNQPTVLFNGMKLQKKQ